MSTGSLDKVECRKATSRVLAESLAVVVTGVVLAGCAWAFLPGFRLGMVLLIVAVSAAILTVTVRNPPVLRLEQGRLFVKCHSLGPNGRRVKAERLQIRVDELARVWVGAPRDYSSDLLMQGFDWKTYPWAKTLVFWITPGNQLYQVREFSWLNHTEELLEQLRAQGVRVEDSCTHPNRT
jgi:hypothetical protein